LILKNKKLKLKVIKIMQKSENKLIISFDNIIEGIVIKRPSKIIKSPYVADVCLYDSELDDTVLSHTPSLGCCGLADKDANVMLLKNKKPGKCSHSVYFSVFSEEKTNTKVDTIVCIYPKLGEEMVEKCLVNNYFSILQNVKSYKRETVVKIENYVDSRFDFSGIDENGVEFYMEIKSVPLADYENLTEKERKLIKKNKYNDIPHDRKAAYFPDGYRKNKEDTVSPRALKHIQELTYLKQNYEVRSIICFVIQRSDVNRFEPAAVDKIYSDAFKEALDNGVEVITLVIDWVKNGNNISGYFVRDNLPIFLN
jgi:DNA-binding sugar fermentation-stimulating protein